MKKMTTKMIAAAVLVAMATTPAFAQTPPVPRKAVSPVLGWIGVATAAVGGAMMVPWPKGENYEFNHVNYCITDNSQYKFNMDRGSCDSTEPMIKAGLITAGIGGAMALIGFAKLKRVYVSPSVGHKAVGGTATIKW